MPTTNHYDTIVVGLGPMGLSSTYHLASSGKKVLGIDQFTPPHSHGSSHGDTRITRLAIGEGEAYTPFAIRSHEIWRELEKRTGRKLLFSVGGLVIGDPSQPSGFHHKSDFLGTTIAAAKRFNIRHEVLTHRDLKKRYFQFSTSNNESAYFEPDAGYLRPEECIRALLTVSEAAGATLKFNERVQDISPTSSGGVSVKTKQREYHADELVVSAGAWLPKLMPEVAPLFRCSRQTLFWFSTGRHYASFTPDKMPVFIWAFSDSEHEGIYGFPALDGPQGGIKIASSEYALTADPDSVDRVVSTESAIEIYTKCIAHRLPLVSKECLKTVTCLYTITPDSDFVIARLPSAPQIVVVSPCSGHGFKHAAAIGETVSELIVQGVTGRDITPFSLKRLGAV